MADRPRIFVCQGCGAVAAVLYGRSIICSCGARSAAEIVGDKLPVVSATPPQKGEKECEWSRSTASA